MSERSTDNFAKASQLQLMAALNLQKVFTKSSVSVISFTTATRAIILQLNNLGKVLINVIGNLGKLSPNTGRSSAFVKNMGTTYKNMTAGTKTVLQGLSPKEPSDEDDTPKPTFLGGSTVDPFRHLKTLAASGSMKAMTAPFKAINKIGAKGFKAMGGAFSSMGPQMALMAMVMGPVIAGLQAFLGPFDLISVYFEAFGTILSQLLMPIMEGLMPLFDGMIPIFEQVVVALMPVVLAIMSLLDVKRFLPIFQMMVPIIAALAGALLQVLDAMGPLIDVYLNGLVVSFTLLGAAMSYIAIAIGLVATAINWFVSLFSGMTDGLNAVSDAFERVINALGSVGSRISDFVDDLW